MLGAGYWVLGKHWTKNPGPGTKDQSYYNILIYNFLHHAPCTLHLATLKKELLLQENCGKFCRYSFKTWLR
jgi:hypothetical protein